MDDTAMEQQVMEFADNTENSLVLGVALGIAMFVALFGGFYLGLTFGMKHFS